MSSELEAMLMKLAKEAYKNAVSKIERESNDTSHSSQQSGKAENGNSQYGSMAQTQALKKTSTTYKPSNEAAS
jgi:hypothetical protein